MAKEKLGVLCSGRGTDLQSIIDAIEAGKVPAEIAIVLTDKEAFALERARKAGIEAVCVDRKQFDGRETFEKALIEKLGFRFEKVLRHAHEFGLGERDSLLYVLDVSLPA